MKKIKASFKCGYNCKTSEGMNDLNHTWFYIGKFLRYGQLASLHSALHASLNYSLV